MFTWQTIRVLALVVSAALCALGQTQQQPVKTETTDSPATGAITGKVLNENGQPLASALVQVRAVNGTGPGQMANTNREGEFRVSDLDRGSYTVMASMPAYVLQPRDQSATQSPTYHIGDSVTLTLIKGGVVTGTVTDANGDPVVAVGVRVQMSRDANGRRTANGFRRETLTDDRGIYRAYGLLPGTYVVAAGGPGWYGPQEQNGFETDVPTYAPSATRDTAMEINVRGGEETVGIDIRYRGEQGRTISGVVNAPPNTGAFNVVLSASGEGAVPWTTTYYQAAYVEGFVFKGIADGEYQLVAMSYGRAGSRDVAAAVKRIVVRGADLSGIELNTAPLATISGRVVLEETKVPECTDKRLPEFNEILVSAWHNDNEAAKETPASLWSIGAPTAPDADGNFTLRNLASGDYYFATRFTAKYWYLQSIAFPAPQATSATAKAPSKPVDTTVAWTKVKAGDRLSGLTVTVAQGAASLRGQLVSEGNQVPEKLFVYLVPSEREKAEAVLRYYAAPVSPDGKIALHNIAPGRYWVVAQTFTDAAATPLTRLRLPHETATRARLRRDAEAAKTEIELKPCQTTSDFQLPFKMH
ncbi:MAG TPA: carboxypeptidase-like regulatory domain-containing protein [Pyrinomonadaceae bacterium]|nr:carboxypeptidase-like regulatory domain-containing protein [Pyrinomonadaceae bacterium]